MNRRLTLSRNRAGFTLIELLVVIAIISILLGLTAAAIMRLLGKREEINARTEIGQLETAYSNFKTAYKVSPLSKIFVASTKAAYNSSPLHQDSLAVLTKICPDWGSNTVDWSGGLGLGAGVVLEGDQALVFQLGGIPGIDASGDKVCLGFSKNRANAAAPGGERWGPFFEDFKSSRLYNRSSAPSPTPFYSYYDPWLAQPYAFFSTGRNPGINAGNEADCISLGIQPYKTNTSGGVIYYHAASVQIICAGADKKFGPGGQWSPAGAESMPVDGRDNLTNLHPKFMGVP